MKKKVAIIVIGVLALVAVFAVGWVIYNQPEQNSADTTSSSDGSISSLLPQGGGDDVAGGDMPSSGSDASGEDGGDGTVDDGPVLQKVVDANIKGATLSANDSGIIFYNESTTQFFSANADGSNQQPLNQTQFTNVEDVVIAPSKTHAILSFTTEGSKIPQKYFYDFEKDLAIKLNENIDEFDFSPDGSKIFYKYSDPIGGVETLNVANANGTDWRSVKDFTSRVVLEWVPGSPEKLSFHLPPSSFRSSAYYVFDTSGENVVAVLTKGYGVDGMWSPDGSRLVSTFASERTINLGLVAVNQDGSEKISLPNSRTFIQKCVWMADNISVICAVPNELRGNIYIPDDYNAGNLSTIDSFFKFNTKTGERFDIKLDDTPAGEEVAVELPDIDAFNLFVTEDGENLYFQNAKEDNALYKLRLN